MASPKSLIQSRKFARPVHRSGCRVAGSDLAPTSIGYRTLWSVMLIADPNDGRHLQPWEPRYRTPQEITTLRCRLFLLGLLGALLIVVGLWFG